MKIIDRKRIGPLLLLMSFAVIGSLTVMLALSSFTGETSTAQAQQQCLDNQDLADLLGQLSCADATATAQAGGGGNGGGDTECLDNQDLADLLGQTSCASLTATAEANAAATAQADADMTATAEANAAATAQAMADMTATAEAEIAAMTATAVANAAATAQAQADATATAEARRTATAEARATRTAIAVATAAAGGSPPPAPRATATPVHIEKVDVMAVEGATTVEPDMSVALMAGNVTVKLPTLSRSRTYQAMLSESDECGNMAAACAMVSIYNAEGEMESDVRLISAAEIEVMLDAATVDALGGDLDGGAVAAQASALGGIMLQLMDDDSGEWNTIPSTFMVNSDGSAMASGMTRRFSHIALMIYDDVVEQARMQLSMALGTPTATPVPPTATPAPPVPTATPVPPTPVPPTPIVIEAPATGDTSVPFLMLLAMAVFASMAALVGTKLIMARVRR